MVADLIERMNQVINVLEGDDERRAYAAGLAHAYTDVFEIIGVAFNEGADLHEVRERVSSRWDCIKDLQIALGVL